MTCFVAFLYLDAKRQIDSRLDVVCCVRDKRAPPHEEGSRGGVLYSLIRDYYSKFVLHDCVRAIVVWICVAGMYWCWIRDAGFVDGCFCWWICC